MNKYSAVQAAAEAINKEIGKEIGQIIMANMTPTVTYQSLHKIIMSSFAKKRYKDMHSQERYAVVIDYNHQWFGTVILSKERTVLPDHNPLNSFLCLTLDEESGDELEPEQIKIFDCEKPHCKTYVQSVYDEATKFADRLTRLAATK